MQKYVIIIENVHIELIFHKKNIKLKLIHFVISFFFHIFAILMIWQGMSFFCRFQYQIKV